MFLFLSVLLFLIEFDYFLLIKINTRKTSIHYQVRLMPNFHLAFLPPCFRRPTNIASLMHILVDDLNIEKHSVNRASLSCKFMYNHAVAYILVKNLLLSREEVTRIEKHPSYANNKWNLIQFSPTKREN